MGTDDDSLTLDVGRPHELLPWADVEGWNTVTRLFIGVEELYPEADRLAAFLASPCLRGIVELGLHARAPLPGAVLEAAAALPALATLEFSGDCVLDPQVERLASSAGLARLRRLRLMFTPPLSVDAFRALAGATFRPALEELWCLQPGLDDACLAALLAAPWPSLRRLELRDPMLGSESEAALAALRERGVEVGRNATLPPGPAVPTHAELAAQILAHLRGPPDARAFRHALALLRDYDDERFEADLRARCEAALAPWPEGLRRDDLSPLDRESHRPYHTLAHTLDLWVREPADLRVLAGPPRLAKRLVLSVDRPKYLGQVDLATPFPSLEALELGPTASVAWHALDWRLPPTLRELDVWQCFLLFDRDGEPATFRRALRRAAPGLCRVRLPRGRNEFLQQEINSAFGPRGKDGMHDGLA
jgi:hypothetical protein